LAISLAAPGTADAKVRTGDRAAEFVKVTDKNGKRLKLRKYKKGVVVLTFGASWCPPCKEELPALEKLAAKYGSSVTFIAVNIDNDRAKGKQFMRKVGLKRVLGAYDPQHSTVDTWEPPAMPTTFVISRGVVKHMHKGFRKGDGKKLAKAIDKELAKRR